MTAVSNSLSEKNRDIAEASSLASQSNFHAETTKRLLDGDSAVDRWLIRAGDWCSPILVKETRQSLKSRQFQWTFMLLMIAIATWTLFAVLTSIPAIYFQPAGKYLLIGYIFLLIIPACVVVPNAAFRSMVGELEQGTFDVLTLSPLSSFQIVTGKLAVACVQSGFYFAALAPCFAVTYLLRGVTWMTILMSLIAIGVCSLMEIAIGLLLGSLDRARRFSTLISIAMIVMTIGAAFCVYGLTTSGIFEMTRVGVDSERRFYIACFFAFSFFAITYVVLIVLAASAAIGMASENYSTTIRWWGLFQSVLMFGLFGAFIGFLRSPLAANGQGAVNSLELQRGMEQASVFIFFVQAIHWAALGIFFVSEQGVITPRSRRSLPSTLLQRIFLSWGNPGSGTGYVFVLLCLSSVFLSAYFLEQLFVLSGSEAQLFWNQSRLVGSGVFAIMLWGWMASYLGLVRLCLVCFVKNGSNRMTLGITLLLIFVFAGTFGTLYLSTWSSSNNTASYEWYSIANIPWSTIEAGSDKLVIGSIESLICVSIVVIGLNWLTLSRDLVVVRVAAPPRVRQELSKTEISEEALDPLA